MLTDHATASDTALPVPGFLDRLGDRVRLTDPGSADVEILRLRPELTASPLFELAVKRRADQLAGFLHPNCARVRKIGRLPAPDGRLVLLSDAIDGWRLSEVLEAADPCGVAFHPDAVLFLLRQLLGVVAALHEVAPGISHGALGTERLVVTTEGRLVVTESVLGGALRHLPPMPSDRLWRDLRLAVADGEAQPFGRLTDLRQIGIVALSLALGRQLRRDEYPTRLASLLGDSTPARPGFGAEGLGPALRGWLLRVLSLTDDLAPWSVADARRELDRIVESDRRHAFAPTGVPVILGTVAGYYADAADVPVPIHKPTVAPEKKVGPVLVRPPEPAPRPDRPAETSAERAVQPPAQDPVQATPTAEAPLVSPAPPLVADVPQPTPKASEPAPEVLEPALEVPQPVPDDAWPEPTVRPVVDQLVDSKQEPLAEISLVPVSSEPPSHAGVAEAQPTAKPPAEAPTASTSAPLPSTTLRLVSPAEQGPAASVGRPAKTVSPSRPLFGVHEAEDTADPIAAPPAARTRTLIGIAAAALVIVSLGGYALVRPSAVTAIATRPALPPPASESLDKTSPASASPAATAPRAAAQPAPTPPRTQEAAAPAAVPDNPAPTGTIEVVSPVSLNVSEGGRALGTSGSPIQVTAGRHTLEIRRDDLGYQAVQLVDVKPGQPNRIQPSLPSGVANLNATPWAEVWIDGRKVGETPLGHVQLPIGPHEVQFRHPEMGEQTRTLVVTTTTVALLSVDFKK
jgi:hypothetical protein